MRIDLPVVFGLDSETHHDCGLGIKCGMTSESSFMVSESGNELQKNSYSFFLTRDAILACILSHWRRSMAGTPM